MLKLDAPRAAAALLSVYGGKITTFRRLVESALEMLRPHLPPAVEDASGWTGSAPLPGGDFPPRDFDARTRALLERYPFLGAAQARRVTRAYGTLASRLLDDAESQEDLGRHFWAGLFEAEVCYLVANE